MIHFTRKCIPLLVVLFVGAELKADFCFNPLIEVKSGYFFFADKNMRSVYNEGGFDVQVSSSLPLWKCFQLYTSIEYLRKKGASHTEKEQTVISQIPVTIGLKALAKLSPSIGYYLTVGPRYFHIRMQNNSCFVDRDLSNNGVGGFVGTGFLFVPNHHITLDVFGEYSYEKTHFHSKKTNVYSKSQQVGGFVFGAGLGYSF